MRVRVFYTGSSSNPDQYVDVAAGSTVRTALSTAGVPTESVSVRVNRTDATLDQVLGAEDQIIVTAKNLKGAADEVAEGTAAITMTVEQIIGWGSGAGAVPSGVVGKALAKQAEKAQEILLEAVQGLIADAKPEAAYINKRIATLTKELAEAQDSQKRFGYALNQLTVKENPFSLLAFLARKDKAVALCHAIGCDVPDAKSPLWKTADND